MEQNEVQVQLDKMKAETNVLIEKLKQEKAKVLTELDSNAKADAERIKSEADLYEAQKMPEAKLQATKNAAKASELMAKAEGVAAPKVEARKQFETRQKQMLVWKGLARNKE